MADRNTSWEGGGINKSFLAAATVVYYGHLLAHNAAGYAVPASDTAGLKVVGMCHSAADNTSGLAGAEYCLSCRGIACWFKNDTTNPVTLANVLSDCYVKDSETVCVAAGSTNSIVAGKVLEIDAVMGVKVLLY